MGVSPSKSCASADTSLSLSMASSGVCAASDARRASRADGLSSSPINDRRRALGGRRPEPRPEPGGSDGNDRASATLRRPPSPPPRCSQESLEAAADARRASACACTRASSEVPDSSNPRAPRRGGRRLARGRSTSEAAPESSESARGSPSRFATDERNGHGRLCRDGTTWGQRARTLAAATTSRRGEARPAEDDGRRLENGTSRGEGEAAGGGGNARESLSLVLFRRGEVAQPPSLPHPSGRPRRSSTRRDPYAALPEQHCGDPLWRREERACSDPGPKAERRAGRNRPIHSPMHAASIEIAMANLRASSCWHARSGASPSAIAKHPEITGAPARTNASAARRPRRRAPERQ